MVTILYATLLIAILSILFAKTIRKYNTHLYVAAIVVVLFTTKESGNLVNLGYVPLAFFVVVLFSGLMEKTYIRKRLFMVRAELAILGSILLFPHAFGYFEYYIERYSIFDLSVSFYLGFLAFLIMLPLTITSIRKVRRKMSYPVWKGLHRLAYLFFLAVALHLILLQNENMILYIAFFGFYFLLKLGILLSARFSNRTLPLSRTA